MSIKPNNETAKILSHQLKYPGIGNPPGTHPSTAISNCFPGLEMDFRNIWRHILEGIILHEASAEVVALEKDNTNNALNKLVMVSKTGKPIRAIYQLVSVDGVSIVTDIKGPRNSATEKNQTLSSGNTLELSNALAQVLWEKAGQMVECIFLPIANPNTGTHRIKLKIRHFFDVETDKQGNAVNQKPVISKQMAQPGELTQSLCSPWQNDYLECGCFYWAASRPDYVNVEPGPDGLSRGHNWLQKNRTKETPKNYIPGDGTNSPDLLIYDELFRNWQKELKFIIGGMDEASKPNAKPAAKRRKGKP